MTTAEYYKKHKEQIYLFNQGSDHNAFEILGAHPAAEDGREGVRFSVWVPEQRRSP